jgi:hypothetical protein
VRGLLTLAVVGGAGAALYRRAQQIAEREERPVGDVLAEMPGRLWSDLQTLPDDVRASADEGVAAARRAAERVDAP